MVIITLSQNRDGSKWTWELIHVVTGVLEHGTKWYDFARDAFDDAYKAYAILKLGI